MPFLEAYDKGFFKSEQVKYDYNTRNVDTIISNKGSLYLEAT